jgi:hypothetical protein
MKANDARAFLTYKDWGCGKEHCCTVDRNAILDLS